ncbi:MAG TPA: glucosaminidase domain-containing protein [Acidisarcina sp.]
MASQEQLNFLQSAFAAAQASDHLWPAYAACETVLESTWGTSQLATQACNLFGQKQSHPQVTGTLMLPTREFLHGA